MTRAAELIHILHKRGETLATCESLTAGLCAAEIASVPGASAVLRGGLITYATDLKQTLAGVPAATLEKWGPVAEQTAIEMAKGSQIRCQSSWAISFTGVAGPDPQAGHDVGEVWIAIVGPDSQQYKKLLNFSQDSSAEDRREYIRRESVAQGIDFLLEVV